MSASAMIYGAEYWARTDGFTTGALNVTAARGRLFSVFFVNASGGNFYVQIFDKASAPGSGDVAIVPPIVIYDGSYGGINFQEGLRFSLGCQVRVATTASYTGNATALATNTAGGVVGWSGIP